MRGILPWRGELEQNKARSDLVSCFSQQVKIKNDTPISIA